MKETTPLEKICRAMSEPRFYPHEVSHLERRDTHISVVFLTGTYAYKIKKPKDLGFLDFRELEDRKRFCEHEVLLNQRLSNGIYLEVVDIVEDNQSNISMNTEGRVIEHAVKMIQLPAERNFGVLLKEGRITHEHIKALGDTLCHFYEKAEKNNHIDTFGDPEIVRYNMEENFRQIQPFAEKLLDPEKWDFICEISKSFLKGHADLFCHRIDTGRIRDGHGDLRTDHVYFYNGIQIIDCIEFNDRFRYGDTALDLAFLMMDLDHLGHPDMGFHLISVYARNSEDPEIYALLDFYAAYRALVRLKVACFSLEQMDKSNHSKVIESIKRYLNQVYLYAVLFGRPTLWVVFGLPASGKSTLARRVANALFLSIFQSDVVRKEVQSVPNQDVIPFNTGMYRPAARNHVYAQLMNLAQEALKKGESVVLDATFSDAKWRHAAIQLSKDLDVDLIFVQCECNHEIIKSRLNKRDKELSESDARLMHFEEMVKNTEPFKAEDPNTHMKIDTDQPLNHSFYQTLSKAYALKCAQVKTLLADLDR